MFLTATEWKGLGGKKADTTNKSYRPLPFDACALSLQPFEVGPYILGLPSVQPSKSAGQPIQATKLNPSRLKF